MGQHEQNGGDAQDGGNDQRPARCNALIAPQIGPQLKQRDPARAETIIAQVLRGFEDYTKDIQAYRAARKALLEAVDAQTK